MLHQGLKNILADKLSNGFICFIRYNEGLHTYERPFKLARQISNLKSASQVDLVDCVTDKFKKLNFDDITLFHLHHVEDVSKCIEESNKIISRYRETADKFDFLRGDAFYNVVFNVESFANNTILTSGTTGINVLAFLNLIRSADIEDYRRLLAKNESILHRLRVAWKSLIMKKYNEVIKSLETEQSNTTDTAIKEEISSIIDVIKSVPQDIDKDLESKVNYTDIIAYWPTLLLPRSKVLDVSQS